MQANVILVSHYVCPHSAAVLEGASRVCISLASQEAMMILVKTELGQQVMKDRSVRLTPRQRSVFILCDGKRSVADVLQASQGLQEDLDALISQDLVARQGHAAAVPEAAVPHSIPALLDAAEVTVSGALGALQPSALNVPTKVAQDRYKAAYPIATQLTAGMGLRGFRLNLAVEAAANWEELVGLLPKMRAALGPDKTAPLERALSS